MNSLRRSVRFLLAASTLCLVACRSPVDPGKTRAELDILVPRLERMTEDWTDLDLFRGLSQDTLEFLAQDFQPEELSALKRRFPRQLHLLERFRARLSPADALDPVTRFKLGRNETPQLLKRGRVSGRAQAALIKRWAEVKSETRRIYGSHKFDNEAYCASECSCLANRLGDAVKSAEPERTVLYIIMTGGCARGGVCLSGGKSASSAYTLHVATVIDDDDGGWSVIDAVIFNDVAPHSLTEWHEQFRHDLPARYTISLRAKTIGSDSPRY